MFSPETIASVHESWRAAARDSDALSERFFAALEIRAPHLARRFAKDPAARRFLLCAMLSTVVSALDVVDAVEGSIRLLGERHRRFDLRPTDFKVFSEVLIDTLERHLGAAWSERDRRAWREALAHLSRIMLDADGAEPAPARVAAR